jgi:transposase InsO family protein
MSTSARDHLQDTAPFSSPSRPARAQRFLQTFDLFFRPVFAFFIVELSSRRVLHLAVTRHPTDAWVAQQLREVTPFGQHPKHLLRDNDTKFGPAFARVAQASGIEEVRIAYPAPRMNAIAERFLGSVRRECLDHVIILGDRHLEEILTEYTAYFNRERPHQGLGQRLPVPAEAPAVYTMRRRSGRIPSRYSVASTTPTVVLRSGRTPASAQRDLACSQDRGAWCGGAAR